MKSKLSVWQWPYSKGYYLLRPWKWFKQLWLNIGDAHDRATKGYCRTDWYEFNEWFVLVAPQMLRDIADKGCAYPGHEPFDTAERWHAWLHKVADDLSKCSSDWAETHGMNQYEKKFYQIAEKLANKQRQENGITSWNDLSDEENMIKKKYFDRWAEINDERKELTKNVLGQLAEHWDDLWD